MKSDIFDDLFVLEIANNHWGDLERGKEIVRQHKEVADKHNIRYAFKLQLRDVDNFIHPEYFDADHPIGYSEAGLAEAPGKSNRYVRKTLATKLSDDDMRQYFDFIKESGGIVMASPFDERSVELCDEFDLDIIKIASQEVKSRTLIEKIADLKRPTIVSNGGADIEDLDALVNYFNERNVPLAINHCVSLYPSEDGDLELNKIAFLRERYPDNHIGLSTHEYNDWTTSVGVAYALGARTFERHIDIDQDGVPVSKYCSLPEHTDLWYASFNRAKEMCGVPELAPRKIHDKEKNYVRSVSRGAYALRDLEPGTEITKEGLGVDYYLAIPLQEKQLSSTDLKTKHTLSTGIQKDQPIIIESE